LISPRPSFPVTFSLHSICHVVGRWRFRTSDESRNVFWLALSSLRESWHNTHHAFPTSACDGLDRWQLDSSALVIRGAEALWLAWDVVRVSPGRQRRAALPGHRVGA
jgi:fatty-acid desaturase